MADPDNPTLKDIYDLINNRMDEIETRVTVMEETVEEDHESKHIAWLVNHDGTPKTHEEIAKVLKTRHNMFWTGATKVSNSKLNLWDDSKAKRMAKQAVFDLTGPLLMCVYRLGGGGKIYDLDVALKKVRMFKPTKSNKKAKVFVDETHVVTPELIEYLKENPVVHDGEGDDMEITAKVGYDIWDPEVGRIREEFLTARSITKDIVNKHLKKKIAEKKAQQEAKKKKVEVVPVEEKVEEKTEVVPMTMEEVVEEVGSISSSSYDSGDESGDEAGDESGDESSSEEDEEVRKARELLAKAEERKKKKSKKTPKKKKSKKRKRDDDEVLVNDAEPAESPPIDPNTIDPVLLKMYLKEHSTPTKPVAVKSPKKANKRASKRNKGL